MTYPQPLQSAYAPVEKNAGTVFAFVTASILFGTQVLLYGVFTLLWLASNASGLNATTLENVFVPLNVLFAFGGFLFIPLAVVALVFAIVNLIKKRRPVLNIFSIVMSIIATVINIAAYISLANVFSGISG